MNTTDRVAMYVFMAAVMMTAATILNGDGAQFGREVLPIVAILYIALAFMEVALPPVRDHFRGESA